MKNEDASVYFASQSKDEDYPIIIDEETSKRYFNLEKIYDSFFTKDSLSIAKEKSKAERNSKQISDSSFTYGEIVRIFI
jgi:hypothetical protein